MEFLRWHAKVISLFAVYFLVLFSVLIPIKVQRKFEKQGEFGKYILSIVNCFSGGVFFGTYLLHMAPEVRELLESSLLKPYHIDYPLPEFFIGLGFFLVFFMEKIIMSAYHKFGKNEDDDNNNDIVLNKIKPIDNSPSDETCIENGHKTNLAFENDDNGQNVEKKVSNGTNVVTPAENGNHDHAGHSHSGHNHGDHSDHSHDEMAARSLILMIGLGIHCIFEGMSLGLKSSLVEVWSLLIALLCHEIIIAFSLGLQLVKYNTTKRVILAGCIYSLITPTGVAIGTAIMETQGSNPSINLVNGILQGIAAGTFIYVIFFEILNGQVSHDSSFALIFSIFIGFGLMAALSAIPHHHDHDHDHDHGNGTTEHPHPHLIW